MSSLEIARRVGALTDRAVRYRIDRLVKSGAIYVGCVVNAEVVGYPVTGDVIIEIAPWKLREAAVKLTASDQVSYVACAPDRGCISIQVTTRNEWELMRFVREVVQRIEGVTKTQVLLVPQQLKDVLDWHAPQR